MEKIKGIFPGIFTIGNMLCGFLAIISIFDNELLTGCWFIILAGFFDALDGVVARFSKTTSKFGTELDSFADFLSFGIAPAFMLYALGLPTFGRWGWILGTVFILCGAFRLARFNLENQEYKDYYTGLPIPPCAFTVAGYILFCYHLWGGIKAPGVLISIILLFSALMVSGIEYETFPVFPLKTKKDKLKLVYIMIALLAIFVKPKLMIFPFGLAYTLSGVGKHIYEFFHFEKGPVRSGKIKINERDFYEKIGNDQEKE